jgi:DNA-binding transcriptional regulator of glucitol operon
MITLALWALILNDLLFVVVGMFLLVLILAWYQMRG